MVVDFNGVYNQKANATFCTDINVEGFRDWIINIFNNMRF